MGIILQEIERLRQILYEEIHSSNDLTNREIIKASEDLDNVLREYYKMLAQESRLNKT